MPEHIEKVNDMAKKNVSPASPASPAPVFADMFAPVVEAIRGQIINATLASVAQSFGVSIPSPAAPASPSPAAPASPAASDKEKALKDYLDSATEHHAILSLTASMFSGVADMLKTAEAIGVWKEYNEGGKLLSPGYVIRKALDVPKGQEKPTLPESWYALRRLENALRTRKSRKSGGATGGGRDFGMTPKRAAIVALSLEKGNDFAAGAAYALSYTFVRDCDEQGKPSQNWDSVYQDFLNDCAIKGFSIVDCVSLYDSGKEKEKEGKGLNKKEALVRSTFDSLFSKKQ